MFDLKFEKYRVAKLNLVMIKNFKSEKQKSVKNSPYKQWPGIIENRLFEDYVAEKKNMLKRIKEQDSINMFQAWYHDETKMETKG